MRIFKNHIRILTIVFFFVFSIPALAEIKVFEKEMIWRAAKNQSQEQAEGLARLEAQRQAIEEAGVFISSLTVVKDYKLEKDEVTQLASGILKTKTVGEPTISIENGIFCVRVKTVIQVDTTILGRQIEAFMKDKGALKREEEAMKKVRELQEQLANLKSSEVKRLEELNARAIALEREREKQRFFREEQALKAKGELSKAEVERIVKEREMQDRINRTLAEQERTKREEAEALAAEQDRVRRASLENEQRMNDLSRRAKLAQESWVVIDDSLSLKQAVEEVKGLKAEIANFKNRLYFQYQANTANLKNAYAQQRALSGSKLPPEPAPKDAFESTAEYNNRIADYKRQVEEAEAKGGEVVEKLNLEEALKLAQAKTDYLGQQIRALEPFVNRLQALQERKFALPEGGAVTVDLGAPDAANNRFPVILGYNGKSYPRWWEYTDRNRAKDFYQTRTYLKAEGIFQLEGKDELIPKLTAVRVIHPGSKEVRVFDLNKPVTFAEIDRFNTIKRQAVSAKHEREIAALHLSRKTIIKKDGRFVAYEDGTVLDTQTGLMWAAQDNGSDIGWKDAKSYCENYRGGGYTDWRMPMQEELADLYDKSKSEGVECSWLSNKHVATELIKFTCYSVWASEIKSGSSAIFSYATNHKGYLPLNSYIDAGGRKKHHDFRRHSRAIPVRSGR